MPTLVVRNVEPATHARLKARAAAHGRSMEEEARAILRESVPAAPEQHGTHLLDSIRAIVDPIGGIDIEIDRQPGESRRDLPDFAGPEWAVSGET